MILNIFYIAKFIYFSRYREIFAIISKNMLPMPWVSPHSLQHRYLYLVSEVFWMRIFPIGSDIWTLGFGLWCYLGRLWKEHLGNGALKKWHLSMQAGLECSQSLPTVCSLLPDCGWDGITQFSFPGSVYTICCYVSPTWQTPVFLKLEAQIHFLLQVASGNYVSSQKQKTD